MKINYIKMMTFTKKNECHLNLNLIKYIFMMNLIKLLLRETIS